MAPTGRQNEGAPAFEERNPRYRLRNGDVIELDFRFTPDFNQTLTIQPDGYLTPRAVNDIHVEGLTVPELTKALENTYRRILKDPVISVVLKEYEKPNFAVMGHVKSAGKYELRGDITIAYAIAMAGGFDEGAKRSQVLLFRPSSANMLKVHKVDVNQMLSSGNLDEDLHLRPGDLLYVPRSNLSKIKPYIPVPSLGLYLSSLGAR